MPMDCAQMKQPKAMPILIPRMEMRRMMSGSMISASIQISDQNCRLASFDNFNAELMIQTETVRRYFLLSLSWRSFFFELVG